MMNDLKTGEVFTAKTIPSGLGGGIGRYTRQRRGCLTCRQRKKKCQQAYPVCLHCSRLNLVCRWEGPRDLRPEPPEVPNRQPAAQRAPRPAAVKGPDAPDLAQLGVYGSLSHVPLSCPGPGRVNEDLVCSRRMMLRYYTATLVFMLTNNLQNNCFLSVLLPMAFECRTLMYALAASSSAHLALTDADFQVTALRHCGLAITELKASMTKGSLTPEMKLAVTLVLCSMEAISSGTDNWIHHLAGAAATLQEARWDHDPLCGGSDNAQATDPKTSLLRYYEGRWLLRNFAYHDIIMSVSLDRRPFISGDYWLSQEGDVADPYFGFGARVIYLIGEISDLKADFADATGWPRHEQPSTEHKGVLPLEAYANGEFSQRAKSIEIQLLDWSCSAEADDESLILLADAYRHAALIHLYRVLRKYIPAHSGALRQKILDSVTVICDACSAMPSGCFAETSMIFPLFIAGGEAEDMGQIEIIRDGLISLNDRRRFRNVDACVATLDEVWRLSTAGTRNSDSSKVDWLDIVRLRDWKLALF